MIAAGKSNRWWFVWEVELAEEGSQLVAADTAEKAKAFVRKDWDPGDCWPELDAAPADDLDKIETWLRSDDRTAKVDAA